MFDADSVFFKWKLKDELIKVHHVGIFFKVLKYSNDLQKEVVIDKINDDSLGAEFFNINELSKKELSAIAIMELEKLGDKLN